MSNKISAQLNNLTFSLVVIGAITTPLLFTPLFTEFYEMSKLVFLIVLVVGLIGLLSLDWVVKGKVLITRSPLDLPLILLLVAAILSTFFSSTREVSIFGNLPKVHGSLVSLVVYTLLYFIILGAIKTKNQVRTLLYGLLFSGCVVAVLSLLSYFNIYLPFQIVKYASFTPTGYSFATVAFLILLLPILLISIIRPNKFLPTGLAMVLSTLFVLVIGLTGLSSVDGLFPIFSAAYLALVICFGLVLWANQSRKFQTRLPLLLVPVILTVAVVAIRFLPMKANPLQSRWVNFPREVQLSFSTSWKVAASAFRDAPFLGTGPASFLFNFSQYKNVEHNNSNFWNVPFDSAYNEFLQSLGTLGGLGLLALVFWSAVVLNIGFRGITLKRGQVNLDDQELINLGLSISAILLIVLMAVHVTTVVISVVGVIILAMLMASFRGYNSKVEELTIGIKASKLYDNNLVVGDILPVIIFIPVLIGASVLLWQTGRFSLADYNHRLALNSASTSGLDTYNYLVKAENLNPRVDLYRTDLAQTNFALANAIAAQKGPSESSPTGSLTDQDKQNIQQLLSQSIQEAQAATVLNPRNPRNFEILASIYRQISGVADNALNFALNSYGRAISLDPLNPSLRISAGGVYYSMKNYDLAVRFFSDAVNLKPDYANAYYNLSVALRDKGDLKNAVAAAQQVVTLLQKDTNNPDYKLASNYLKDLQASAATGSAKPNVAGASAETSNYTPPAAENSGPLQQKNLPKVLDLPTSPANVATPPAVKR